jgi:hypothetical protein
MPLKRLRVQSKNIKWGELGRVTFRAEEEKKMEYQAEVRIGFEVLRDNKE